MYQIRRYEFINIGHQQPAEIVDHCILIEDRQCPYQLQQEFAGIFDPHAKLSEGTDRYHDLVFRVLQLKRCTGPPLHIHGVYLVHKPYLCGEWRLAAERQVHHIRQNWNIRCA